MAFRNTTTEYGALAKWLHWLVAVGIVALLWLGFAQADMDSGPERTRIRAIHASIALIVLVLMTLRLVWRAINPLPAHPAGTPNWQRLAARSVHWTIYVALFLQLVSGSFAVATGGNPLPFFDLVSIPLPIAESRDAHEFWEEIHEFSWRIIVILLGVHVFAALYNHFVLKNDVLRRMTVGVRRGSHDA